MIAPPSGHFWSMQRWRKGRQGTQPCYLPFDIGQTAWSCVALHCPAWHCSALLGPALPCFRLNFAPHHHHQWWFTMITPGFLPCWSQLDKMSWLHGSIHLQHNHHHHHNIFINCVTRYKSVLQILSKRCQRKHLIFAQTRFCANAVCSFLGSGGWPSIACAINFNSRIGTILACISKIFVCATPAFALLVEAGFAHIAQLNTFSTAAPSFAEAAFALTVAASVAFSCLTHSSCLESLYTLILYDELSAAVEEGVGEHRQCLPPPPQQHSCRCLHNYNQLLV